ncbi:MAG TPA: zinc ribbon domain-containing protein [Acidobacteriota bacterium]|nr:zinc ribbon domain-containing protein [Acidobacteriota bacterium]
MPIYEYTCKSCGAAFEVLQKIGERSAECPACGADAERVAASQVSVVASSEGAHQRESCDRSTPCCGLPEPCNDRSCH